MDWKKTEHGPHIEGPDGDGFFRVIFEKGHDASYRGVHARPEGKARARIRIEAGPDRNNAVGTLHGGFLLSFLDHALFVGAVALGRIPGASAVTLSLATQFVDAGEAGVPVDCMLDIVRETGRLMFLSGTLEQEARVILSWQATLRKVR